MARPIDRDDVVHREITREYEPEEYEEGAERIATGLDWAVGALVTDDDGRVLMVEQGGQWMLPGGEVETGESHAQALRREMREETGLDVDVGDPLAVLDITVTDGDRETGYCFAAYAAASDGRVLTDDPGLDDEAIDAVAWQDGLPENTLQRDLIADLLDG